MKKTNNKFSFNTKSQANRFQLLSIISVLLLLPFAFSLHFYGGIKEAATFAATQPGEAKQTTLMPRLEGDKAREYLNQQGLSDSLGKAVTKARYKVRQVEKKTAKTETAQFEAGNPGNGYHAKFKADGTTELIGGKNNRWNTSIRLLKFGRGENLKTVAAGSWESAASRAEYRRGMITEWFENKPSGLEHGFTIAEKPEAATNETQQLRVLMKIGGNLRPRLDENGQALTLGNRILRYSKLKVLDDTGAELSARMLLRGKELTIEVDDSKAVYPIEIDPVFEPVKKITASDGAAGDFFGVSVSISGDTAIVGAEGDDGYKGAAYIFERNQGGANNWGEVKKLTGSGTTQPAGDQSVSNFGYSVSISGDTAIVGMNALVQVGNAWIFERNGGGMNNWGEVKKLTASDGAANDQFGISVSISVDTVIVGASGDDNSKGSAYIFKRNTGGINNWGQVKKLTASDGAAGDEFGYSVLISGDTAIVGSVGDDNVKGSAHIFASTPTPTAASVTVGGRLLTAQGRGIANARVRLTEVDGNVRTVSTGAFGYYRFSDVSAGQTVILEVFSKRFGFANSIRVMNVTEEITDADFLASP